MSVSLLAALLWVPFGVVVIIAGAIFLTAGYKRGLWRALISTGATVVATLVSMLIAKLLANPLASAVLRALPEMDSESGITAELTATLVKGVVGVVLSLALFSMLLLIFSIVLKCVGNRVQKDKLTVDQKSLKWAGLGVRLVDTVLFALLLMLPLYGTIATYVPTVQVVMQMQEKPDSEAQAYIDVIAAHPVVQMSGNGPAAWVYTGLSDVQMNEGSVNIADMAQTVDGLVKRAEKIAVADESEIPGLVEELIGYARKNVIEAPWCYELAQELLGYVEEYMRTSVVEEDHEYVDAIIALFQMNREEFIENGTQVLDFAAYVLNSGIIDNEEAAEAIIKTDGFLTRMGSLMNCTKQAVAMKNLLILSFMQDEVFDGDDQAANAFLAGRLSETATAVSLQKQEAQAFIMMTEARTREQYIEALVQLPCLTFTEAEADLLPEDLGYDYEDIFGGFTEDMIVTPDGDFSGNYFVGEDGAVTGIIRDENGNMVIVDGEGNIAGNITGSIIYGDPEDVSDVPMYTIEFEN